MSKLDLKTLKREILTNFKNRQFTKQEVGDSLGRWVHSKEVGQRMCDLLNRGFIVEGDTKGHFQLNSSCQCLLTMTEETESATAEEAAELVNADHIKHGMKA